MDDFTGTFYDIFHGADKPDTDNETIEAGALQPSKKGIQINVQLSSAQHINKASDILKKAAEAAVSAGHVPTVAPPFMSDVVSKGIKAAMQAEADQAMASMLAGPAPSWGSPTGFNCKSHIDYKADFIAPEDAVKSRLKQTAALLKKYRLNPEAAAALYYDKATGLLQVYGDRLICWSGLDEGLDRYLTGYQVHTYTDGDRRFMVAANVKMEDITPPHLRLISYRLLVVLGVYNYDLAQKYNKLAATRAQLDAIRLKQQAAEQAYSKKSADRARFVSSVDDSAG